MPKRRKHAKKPLTSTNIPSLTREEEPDLTDPSQYLDEIDSYYTSRQSGLSSGVATGGFEDPLLSHSEGETSSGEYEEREEVFALNLTSSEEEVEDRLKGVEQYFSDESGEGEGDEVGGWGSKRRTFYDTDFVGDEKGRREDVELALEEEREAISLQKILTEGLTESDFLTHDLLSALATSRPDNSESRREDQLQLSDSPEIADLIRDLDVHLSQLSSPILPALSTCRSMSSPPDSLLHYLDTRSRLSLTYCSCILFYLSLRASGVSVATHPVCERLVSCRSHISQLSVLDKDLHPDLQVWLSQQQQLGINSKQKEIAAKISPNNEFILEAESNEPNRKLIISDSDINSNEKSNNTRQVKFTSNLEKYSCLTPLQFYDTIMKEREDKKKLREANRLRDNESHEGATEDKGDTKRAIDYSIRKNKGLTPRRKKEMRNPRVHQRMKYKRALKQRKGQVADMRPRVGVYPGEMTGIRDDISKSRKIHS